MSTQTFQQELRALEGHSIRKFMMENAHQLKGNVLDFGSGTQPYRDIVEAAGCQYFPHDADFFPGSRAQNEELNFHKMKWNTIICNQVIQFVESPSWTCGIMRYQMNSGAKLIMTYPTAWPELDPQELWRFTKTGMELLLREAGFVIEEHKLRFTYPVDGFPVGYGVVARA